MKEYSKFLTYVYFRLLCFVLVLKHVDHTFVST